MTKDMPLGGQLSLDMMYRTCGTQLNIDYNSEEDFIKKFKIVNSIVPISIALFANSSIIEKKNSKFLGMHSFNYLTYRELVGLHLLNRCLVLSKLKLIIRLE